MNIMYKFNEEKGFKYSVNDKDEYHSHNDLPAIDYLHKNMKVWYKNGVIHRDECLGPAVISRTTVEYYREGKLHRILGEAKISGIFVIKEKCSAKDGIINGKYEMTVCDKIKSKIVHSVIGQRKDNKREGVWQVTTDISININSRNYQLVFIDDALMYKPSIIVHNGLPIYNGEIKSFYFTQLSENYKIVLQSEKDYIRGKLYGDSRYYDFTGCLFMSKSYIDNVPHGTCLYFSKTRDIYKIEEYDKGNVVLTLEFDYKGELVTD